MCRRTDAGLIGFADLGREKHAILAALQAWPQRSGWQVAEQVGCDRTDVDNRMRTEVVTSHHLSSRVTGDDGRAARAL